MNIKIESCIKKILGYDYTNKRKEIVSLSFSKVMTPYRNNGLKLSIFLAEYNIIHCIHTVSLLSCGRNEYPPPSVSLSWGKGRINRPHLKLFIWSDTNLDQEISILIFHHQQSSRLVFLCFFSISIIHVSQP